MFDRDTKELLSYSEYSATISGNKNVNMITFSSGTDMCLDNVRIYNTSCEKVIYTEVRTYRALQK